MGSSPAGLSPLCFPVSQRGALALFPSEIMPWVAGLRSDPPFQAKGVGRCGTEQRGVFWTLSTGWLQLNKATCQHVGERGGGQAASQHPSASRPCHLSLACPRVPVKACSSPGSCKAHTSPPGRHRRQSRLTDEEPERLGGHGHGPSDSARRGRGWTESRCTAQRLPARGHSTVPSSALSSQGRGVLPPTSPDPALRRRGAAQPPLGRSEDRQGRLSSPGLLHGFKGGAHLSPTHHLVSGNLWSIRPRPLHPPPASRTPPAESLAQVPSRLPHAV